MTRTRIASGQYELHPGWARGCPVVDAEVRPDPSSASCARVKMQIDSGADVTVLPAAILALPGFVRAGTHTIRGVTGHASEFPLVRLCFGVGSVRVPSLWVCVAERAVGLIGRDLLDRVVLELDGPHQQWTMSR